MIDMVCGISMDLGYEKILGTTLPLKGEQVSRRALEKKGFTVTHEYQGGMAEMVFLHPGARK